MFSYKKSHVDKGLKYHNLFSSNPRRCLLWQMEKKTLKHILNKFFKNTKPTHLDFACGTGRIITFLNKKTSSSTGIDISHSMLNIAQKDNPNIEFIEGDLSQKDLLKNRTFDLITAFRFFPNAEPKLREEVLSILTQSLNKNGLFVFNLHTNSGCLKSRLVRFFSFGKRGNFGCSCKELEDLFEKNNLNIVKRFGMGYLPEYETMLFPFRPLINILELLLFKLHLPYFFAENIIYIAAKR